MRHPFSNGDIAHLVERLNGIQEVDGSSPFISTSKNRLFGRFFCWWRRSKESTRQDESLGCSYSRSEFCAAGASPVYLHQCSRAGTFVPALLHWWNGEKNRAGRADWLGSPYSRSKFCPLRRKAQRARIARAFGTTYSSLLLTHYKSGTDGRCAPLRSFAPCGARHCVPEQLVPSARPTRACF